MGADLGIHIIMYVGIIIEMPQFGLVCPNHDAGSEDVRTLCSQVRYVSSPVDAHSLCYKSLQALASVHPIAPDDVTPRCGSRMQGLRKHGCMQSYFRIVKMNVRLL